MDVAVRRLRRTSLRCWGWLHLGWCPCPRSTSSSTPCSRRQAITFPTRQTQNGSGHTCHATPATLHFTTPRYRVDQHSFRQTKNFAHFPSGTSAWKRHDRLLPAAEHRDAVLHLLLHGGNEGSVPGSKSSQEAELEVPHKVHDVVPEA